MNTPTLPAPQILPPLKSWQEAEWKEVDVEVTPGYRKRLKLPVSKPMKYVVQRLMKNPKTGEYFCLPVQPFGPCVRFTTDLTEQLGLPFSRNTLKRLLYAGFVDGYRVGPMTTLVDLSSLWDFLDKVRIRPDEPPFWNDTRRDLFCSWREIGSEEDRATLDYETDED
jgi:hypothetical protein